MASTPYPIKGFLVTPGRRTEAAIAPLEPIEF